MRKLGCIVLAAVLAAAMAEAGGPPDRGGRDRGGDRGGRRGRGGMADRMRAMMAARGGPGGFMDRLAGRGGAGNTDIFGVAKRAFELADDNELAVDNLAIQYAVDESDAVAELRKRLNKEYLVKILVLLPDEEKPKYEKVLAAMTERDDALAAAQKELRAVLDKVKANQGADKVKAPDDPRARFFRPRPGTLPTTKMAMLTTCFVITAEQKQEIDDIQRQSRDGMRDKLRDQMRALFAAGPDGQRDPNARDRARDIFRKAREDADEANVKVVAEFLSEGQKKDFTAACTAMDTCKKKTTDAEAACRKKVVGAVGEEKATAILGPAPGAKPATAPKTDF